MMKTTRIGFGFDCHKFDKASIGQNQIMLCGVSIPCKYRLIAHSDGDTALHALTDALLGAISTGDIGTHFPPSDPKWAGQSSDYFVGFAMQMLSKEHKGQINNMDLTIVTEIPKIVPHREAMINRLADILLIRPSQIGLKATTTEGLGIVGQEGGIACYAVVSITA